MGGGTDFGDRSPITSPFVPSSSYRPGPITDRGGRGPGPGPRRAPRRSLPIFMAYIYGRIRPSRIEAVAALGRVLVARSDGLALYLPIFMAGFGHHGSRRVLVAHHREVQRHHRAARPHDEPHNVVHVVAGARAGGRRRGPRLSVFKAISIDSFLSPQKRGDDTVRTPSTAKPPPPASRRLFLALKIQEKTPRVFFLSLQNINASALPRREI